MKKAIYFFSSLLLLVILQTGFGTAQSLSDGKAGPRVMTYNVDEGTDFLEVQAANGTFAFLQAVGQTITNVRLTDPPARMQAVATQIVAAQPDLVSLQEVDKWSSAPVINAQLQCGPSFTVEFDMLQELLDALAAQGAHYQVASRVTQYNFPAFPGLLPPSYANGLCVKVLNENVILARSDLDPSKFQLSNPQSGQFTNIVYFTLPNPPGGTLPEPRSWCSVDVNFKGRPFRFIDTHLESNDAAIRRLEGGELRALPNVTSLPVIVAMDSNAPAAPLPQDLTYTDFIGAGYNDVWSQIAPEFPGFTCCQAPLDNNLVSQLYQRIDLILTLGDIEAQKIALFGATTSSKTPGGLWPADHAGVAAQLKTDVKAASATP